MDQKTIHIRDKILLAALDDVIFDGWQWHVVEKAAETAGYSADMAFAVFPEKLPDVLKHFSDWADRQMLAVLENVDIDTMRIRDRIRLAVLERLTILEPYKEAVRSASSYWLSPVRKLEGAKVIWDTADKIWIWAGDEATDYNRYTKRGLLAGVITSTTIVWMNDKSANYQKTRDFLDNRIENVLMVGKAVGKILGHVKSFKPPFKRKES